MIKQHGKKCYSAEVLSQKVFSFNAFQVHQGGMNYTDLQRLSALKANTLTFPCLRVFFKDNFKNEFCKATHVLGDGSESLLSADVGESGV